METKKWTTEEQIAHRKEWVEALRSGKYQKGKHYLCTNGKEFCCLGVLEELAGVPYKDIPTGVKDMNERNIFSTRVYYDVKWSVTGEETFSTCSAMDYVGLRTAGGAFDGYDDWRALTIMNDHMDTFEGVAKAIETEPEGLFTVRKVDYEKSKGE